MKPKSRAASKRRRLSLWNQKTLGKALGSEIQGLLSAHLQHLSELVPNVSTCVYVLEKGHLLLLASLDILDYPGYAQSVSFADVKSLFDEKGRNRDEVIRRHIVDADPLHPIITLQLRSKKDIKGLIVILATKAGVSLTDVQRTAAPVIRSMTGLLSTIFQLLHERSRSLRLRRINKICQTIDTFIAPEKLYKRIVDLIQQSFNYDHAAIYLLNHDRKALQLETFAGKYRGKIPEDQVIPVDKGIVGWVASHGKTLVSNEARQDPHFLNLTPESIPTEAELCVPIRVGSDVIGVLNIEHSELRYFDEDDINTIEVLADRIGVAIKNSQIFADLNKGHNLLEEIVSSVGHGLMMVDRNFRVYWINETFRKWGFEEMVGKECFRYLNWEQDACRNCPSRKTFETGKIHRDILRTKTGKSYAVTSAPVKDPRGSVTRVLEVVEDITASLQARDQLEYLKRELLRSQQLASIGELAANIVHEVRNPVNAMSQAVELLESDLQLSGEQRQLMNVVKEECARLNDTLGTYLSLAHKQREFARADLGSIISSVLELLRVDLTIYGRVKFLVNLPDNLPPVLLDANATKQVFWNLFLNAAESIKGNGRVEIRGSIADSRLSVSIQDTGKGIDPEILPRIFEPFYTTKGHGTGLGLAIVKRIIDDHGWTIKVQSELGTGSKFTIDIPVT